MTREPRLDFRFEWETVPGVRAPELHATWARLEIWVGGECASLLEERDAGAARRSVYGALYPLAEWIAFNWWLLCSHTRPGESTARRERSGSPLARGTPSWAHHNIRAAGDGQAWPNLTLVPLGRTTHVQWRADPVGDPALPVRFLSHGDAELPSDATQATLGRLVDSVLARLSEQGVAETPLAKEWEAIRTADEDETAFCHAAARLGLDPYAVTEEQAASILRAGHELAGLLLDDFLDSVTPARLVDGLAWVQRASRRLHSQPCGSDGVTAGLATLPRESGGVTNGLEPPWQVGYRQAGRVRSALDLPVTDPFPVDSLIRVAHETAPDPRLIALAGRTDDHSGALVTGRKLHQASQRFAQARALWHLVHEPHTERFLLGPTATERHRTTRAFAAELLAPADGIRAQLASDAGFVSDEEIASISRRFKTSELVITHQVENQLGLVVGEL